MDDCTCWEPRRIIPARAGFTHSGPASTSGAEDHPRSRGVYRSTLMVGCVKCWIIPARAGFTHPSRSPLMRRTDHPRSRGVYPSPRPKRRSGRGSSPLARGLRLGGLDRLGHERIIPARAGFTRQREDRLNLVQDHPRSRGVYYMAVRISPSRAGSSPLARGLRLDDVAQLDGVRIIPARAGFTRSGAHRGAGGPDHPRSRGVYDLRTAITYLTAGSSPLARGLRMDPMNNPDNIGIIPARAGFT